MSFIISFIIFMTSYNFAQQADEIIGNYHLPNDLDIEIFKDNGKYLGKIIALNGFKDGQTNDINNPNNSKQNDLLIGKVIITNLEYDKEEKQWLNGKMYGPEKGMIFNLKITKIHQNEIEIVGSKYFFWNTMTWTRI
ncbi:MAG: DUF2147 domain-containing protein [Bacteroidetes bacterium]|nr:DUF2147 domain-containing protein [Bacteroidota bacterium]